MIGAWLRACAQLADPAVRSVLVRSVLLSVAAFVLLWLGVWFLLARTAVLEVGWLDAAIDVLGGLATLVLTWVLFPAVLSTVIGMFLEEIAGAVEARHYPDLGPAPGLGFAAGLLVALRFLLVMLAANLLLLGLLLVPAVFPFAFYGLNGYLLGREYLELVALRRMDAAETRNLRRRNAGGVVLFGIATAFLLTVPVLNLLVPVVATGAMVHRVEGWRRR